jgi:hypothetical protein
MLASPTKPKREAEEPSRGKKTPKQALEKIILKMKIAENKADVKVRRVLIHE